MKTWFCPRDCPRECRCLGAHYCPEDCMPGDRCGGPKSIRAAATPDPSLQAGCPAAQGKNRPEITKSLTTPTHHG